LGPRALAAAETAVVCEMPGVAEPTMAFAADAGGLLVLLAYIDAKDIGAFATGEGTGAEAGAAAARAGCALYGNVGRERGGTGLDWKAKEEGCLSVLLLEETPAGRSNVFGVGTCAVLEALAGAVALSELAGRANVFGGGAGAAEREDDAVEEIILSISLRDAAFIQSPSSSSKKLMRYNFTNNRNNAHDVLVKYMKYTNIRTLNIDEKFLKLMGTLFFFVFFFLARKVVSTLSSEQHADRCLRLYRREGVKQPMAFPGF
jgi:hypothetical protein